MISFILPGHVFKASNDHDLHLRGILLVLDSLIILLPVYHI
jgi:hypothetical protein